MSNNAHCCSGGHKSGSPPETNKTPTVLNSNNSSTSQKDIKIILLGDSNVGKTSLLLCFVEGQFIENVATLNVSIKPTSLTINDQHVNVQLWDTGGQERFRSLTTSYYRNAAGVLLVYDVTNKQSFANLSRWKKEIEVYAHDLDNDNIFLVGNKIDLFTQRQVSTEEAQNFAKEIGLGLIETSAKEGTNVKTCLMKIVEKCI